MTIEAFGIIFSPVITQSLRDIKILRRFSAAMPLLIRMKGEGD
jgi:hypothetical protein